jgi:plasmid stabilization system protein ParE
MKLRFTRRAQRHLAGISEYIAERDPRAATRVGARIRETIELLRTFPYIGREGVLSGTREVVVPGLPYIVVYRIAAAAELVDILGVYHGAQMRPGQETR